MPTDLLRKPSRNGDFRFEELDGETVVYDPARAKATYLNDTATAVWTLCDGTRTVGAIIEVFAAEFADARDEIARDVLEAIASFDEAGLLTPPDEAGA